MREITLFAGDTNFHYNQHVREDGKVAVEEAWSMNLLGKGVVLWDRA